MRLYRKIAVWRLDKVGSTNTSTLGGKFSLIGNVSQVFDHGIAVNDLECVIRKWQLPSVTDHPVEFSAAIPLHRYVKNGYMRSTRH